MCYQCNKGHLQIIQFSVNRWIILPAQVLQRELSMGSLNPQLQHLCPVQLQASFLLLCNVLILPVIYYCCVLYHLCRFLLNRKLNFCPEFNFFFKLLLFNRLQWIHPRCSRGTGKKILQKSVL